MTGTLVSEGGPRPSIAFVHDDPTLCSAAEWWSGLARAAAALVVAFAFAGVAVALAAGASVAGLAAWLLAAGAGGALLQLAATVRRERRLDVQATPEPPGPAPLPALHRLAGALLARAWVAWPVIVIAGGGHTPSQALAAAAWAPAVTAAWTACGAAAAAWRIRRWERHRGVEVLFAAGMRQRALSPPVIRAATG